jgi:hypothetical protein
MKSKTSINAATAIAFRWTKYDAERTKAQAEQRNMSLSEYIREAVKNFERYSNTEQSIKNLEHRLFRRLFKLNSAIAGLTDEELAEAQIRYKELLTTKRDEK